LLGKERRRLEIAGQDFAKAADYARQIEILRHMTGDERVTLALEMRQMACEVLRAGIRAQHPDFSGERIERELARRVMMAHGTTESTTAHR
jgi:hypothetical protein